VAAAAVIGSLLVPTPATTLDTQPVAAVAPSKPTLTTITEGSRSVVTAAPRVVPASPDTVTAAPRVLPGTHDTVTVPGAPQPVLTETVTAPPVTVTADPPPPVTKTVTVVVHAPVKESQPLG
jgi:hypothetical protein